MTDPAPRRRPRHAATAGQPDADATLAPLRFDAAMDGEQTRTVSGSFAAGAPDWVYLPVDVPSGVREIAVRYSYDRPEPISGVPGNALDIGIFDDAGHDLGDGRGFRGWSGGARDRFTISASDATPGYLPGPIAAGTWSVLLSPYTVHPQGMRWTVEVTLRFGAPDPPFVARPAPDRAAGRGRAWYRGDLHLHTVHSDGQRPPEQLVAEAREAGLDFIASTEHNTSSASAVWGHHATDDLLIIDGEEVTTRNGHLVAVGLRPGAWIDWRHRAVDGVLDRFLREIHGGGAIAIAAHPHAPCGSCRWKFGYAGVDAVEVWNGPWTPDDEIAVAHWDALLIECREGWRDRWLPAVGDSDAHRLDHRIGSPQTVVLADDLTRAAVLDAVRAGRAYLAESAAVSIALTASAAGRVAGIGERLHAAPADRVDLDLTVTGAPGTTALVHTDRGLALERPVPGDGRITWTTHPRRSAYARVEIRRSATVPDLPGSMVALSNPIFLGG